ncbi:MAG: VWA domain-containing protein [Kiritimatiellia bacterium]|jgi:Ca-activated chloride channel family protein
MIEFASPLAFLLFIPWGFAAWRLLRRARRQAAPFPGLSLIPRVVTWRQRLSVLPPYLMLIGLAALILASARPRSLLSKSRKTTEAIAIQMTVDVSGSMLALDFSRRGAPPSERKTRLDVVKETFADFVKRRPDDLIGLVAFGGYATTRCPLTLDHAALAHVLSKTEVPINATDPLETATAIGDGLAMACARLAAATNVESRIVILLSDGESNAGIVTPEQATAVARQQGVKVYTIGVGSTGLAEAVGRDMFGREVVGTIHVSMDEATLKRIAAATGGEYYNVRDKNALEAALEAIDKLQKTEIDQSVFLRFKEYYRPFLAWGSVAVLAALLLSGKTRRVL